MIFKQETPLICLNCDDHYKDMQPQSQNPSPILNLPLKNKVLLIDDNADILEILKDCFIEAGYQVKAVGQVNDIYELIDDFQPDLVITDYILNGINGGEFCNQIKMAYQNLPVIILSAYPKVMLSLGTYNCDLFMAKPFDIYKLIEHANQLIFSRKSLFLSAQPA